MSSSHHAGRAGPSHHSGQSHDSGHSGRGPALPRRAFLRAAGAVLALPLFESLLPRMARAAPTAPKRFVGWFMPCGVNMATWRPKTTGADWQLTPALSALAPVRTKTLVLSGLANRSADAGVAGQHAAGTASYLTTTVPKQTEGDDIRNGTSLDQVLASTLGASTRFPSLQLGVEESGSAGGAGMGYSPVYFRNISWASPTQWLPAVTSPFQLFNRLFGGYDPKESAAATRRRLAYKSSILDGMTGEAARLRARLGTTDRKKLDQYTDGVRALEKRVTDTAPPSCARPDAPIIPLDLPTLTTQHIDLMVLAFQCDLTRVITFMMGQGASNQAFPFLNVAGAHHELSHHGGDPAKLAQLSLIDAWEVQQFAALAARLDALTDVDGRTLLDHSALLCSSEVSDGDRHNHDDLPVLLAGTASGAIKTTGQHLAFQSEVPLANLHLSLLSAFDLPAKSFGADGTRTLPELV